MRVTPGGVGKPLHFDGNVSINVQTVGGTKLATIPGNPTNPPVAVPTLPIDPNNLADVAKDLALVFIDPTVQDSPTGIIANIYSMFVERPSFTVAGHTTVTAVDGGITDFFSPLVQLAGFSGTNTRTVGGFTDFQFGPEPWGAYWFDPNELKTGTEEGDSGGPMFSVRADGSRDVMGVNSIAGTGYGGVLTSGEADITNPTAKNWISTNATDATSYTQNWLCKHHASGCSGFSYPPRWYGEADYVGPCQAGDSDCDHWFDANDNCPNVYNPSQTDSNDDGVGDACPCPCDVASGYKDYDRDGVCAVACSWQQQDNCPKVPNADQANCNLDAEIAHGMTTIGVNLLGNACDSVPCPTSKGDVTTHADQVCTGNVIAGGTCTSRRIHDEIDTLANESHVITADPIDDPLVPTAIAVNGVASDMRFCQSNVAGGFNCAASVNVQDKFIGLPEPTPPSPSQVWHKITQGKCGSSCYVKITDDARGDSYTLDYTDAYKDTHGWDYVADSNYWTTGNLIPTPGNYAGCVSTILPGTCLDGSFWSHAETPVGNTATPSYGGLTVGSHGDQLANHFFPIRPDSFTTFSYAGVGSWHPILLWRTLPDPYEGALQHETHILVNNGVGGQLGAMQNDGTSTLLTADMGAVVSRNLQLSLNSATSMWASAVEPVPGTGLVDGRVEAVALSTDGSTMLDIALTSNGALVARSETTFPDFVTRSTTSHPTGRVSPIAFYSSAAGGVFMMGGNSPASGQPMHDIWFRQMNNDWGPVHASNYTPGTIVAATYSYTDRQLYVLDLVTTGQGRLVRIDPRTGIVSVLGAFPHGPMYTSQHMTIDLDGSVLLTTSNASASLIGHVAVDNAGNGYISKIDASEGGLTFAPIVDANGYSLITGTTSYTTKRLTKLAYGKPGKYPLAQMFP